ncbi:MAG: hypothetical protein FJ276_05520 [Planctomycetes bacterium]|nr:hypothetical protein [Planctomycetota bacterium]
MMRHLLVFSLVWLAAFTSSACAAQFTVEQDEHGVTVRQDGQLFARYLVKSGTKPIVWPLIGPSGKEMTRGYPMRAADEKEKSDHVHQRSCWFTHGDVNGISFWAEQGACGTINHREFLEVRGGERAVVRARNDWAGSRGELICRDVRKLTFACDEEARWIDFEITVTAGDNDVVFGDTKEGSFGLRVAGSMNVDRREGGKIVNSEGQTNEDAWGKRAAWVDYSGPVDGETVGVAILDHPKSLRYPTYWHVRTYGLFAANPFGVRDFLGTNAASGALKVESGTSFSLFYRVVLHRGDEKTGKIDERFRQYAAQEVGK